MTTEHFAMTEIDGQDCKTTACYVVTGTPGDTTISAPAEIRVVADGRAVACDPSHDDEVYPSLDDLLTAYTLSERDIRRS